MNTEAIYNRIKDLQFTSTSNPVYTSQGITLVATLPEKLKNTLNLAILSKYPESVYNLTIKNGSIIKCSKFTHQGIDYIISNLYVMQVFSLSEFEDI